MAHEEIKKNIILLGDAAVGKTSLIRRYVLDQFDERYVTTIGSKDAHAGFRGWEVGRGSGLDEHRTVPQRS